MSAANNTDAEEMKQLLEHWIAELHRHAPDSIGDLLHFSVKDCDPEAKNYEFLIGTEQWMQNAFGSLHGGIIATMLDQGMGMLATCLMHGQGITPSIQLNITYHRPLLPKKEILLKVHVDSVTKTLLHLRAEAMHSDAPEKLCVTGTGIFYYKPFAEEKKFTEK